MPSKYFPNPILSGMIFCCLSTGALHAQNAPVTEFKPAFQGNPADEKYDALADANLRTSTWHKVKYIPVTDESYLTIGGEIRPRIEVRDHLGFGRGAEDEGLNTQLRSRLWASWNISQNIRLFGELQSAFTTGNDIPSSLVDESPLELEQAFVELNAPLSGNSALSLRIGRQHLLMGKKRIFDTRGAPNFNRAFDAINLQGHVGKLRFGVIGGAPLLDKPGTLNDSTNSDYKFVAAHAGRKMDEIIAGSDLELIYIHTDRKVAPLPRFVGKRDSLSVHLSGKSGGLDYDLEVIGQHGNARTLNGVQKVRAWYVGTDSGYTLPGAWSPRIGVKVDIGSGDKNPNDMTMGSYDFLWALSMTWTPELGYTNLISAGPNVRFKPDPKLTVDLAGYGLWRTTRKDGLYNMVNHMVRTADEGRSRYVGIRSTAKVEYQWNAHLLSGLYLNRTFAGDFLKETGDGKNLFYSALYTTFRF